MSETDPDKRITATKYYEHNRHVLYTGGLLSFCAVHWYINTMHSKQLTKLLTHGYPVTQ